MFGIDVPGNAFSFERAYKTQCKDRETYSFLHDCEERSFFEPLIKEAFLNALSTQAPKTSLLEAVFANEETQDEQIRLDAIQYAQLKPASQADLQRITVRPAPEEYDSFTIKHRSKDKQMVQAPDGRYYEITNARIWAWSVCFIGTLFPSGFSLDQDGNETEPGEIHYAFSIRMQKRGELYVYDPRRHKATDECVSISLGEINRSTNRFVEWQKVMVDDAVLKSKLFFQSRNDGNCWPVWKDPFAQDEQEEQEEQEEDVRQELDEAVQGIVPTGPNIQQRWQLEPKGSCMAYMHLSKNNEPSWIPVCNFTLEKYHRQYQFVEDGADLPWHAIICRVHLEGNLEDGKRSAYFMSAEDSNRTPNLDEYGFLDVEVLVQWGKLRSTADVKAVFQSFHSYLVATSLNADMLSCWVADQPMAPLSKCIVRFGRQHNDEFVTGNLVFKGRTLQTLEKANVCIVPHFFINSALPLPKIDYPRNIIIPQDHVRYVIGHNYWNHLSPAFFQNNTMPAKAVFCAGVMGLFYTKITHGEHGLGKIFPIPWIYSPEGNTGKSQAMIVVNDMLGFMTRGPWTADATKPAIYERLNQQQDMSVAIDDLVTGPESKTLQQLFRGVSERTTRAVTGKVRRPHSCFFFTVTPFLIMYSPSPSPSSHAGSGPTYSSLTQAHPIESK